MDNPEKKYELNSDQYECLVHYKNMFKEIASDISDLCSSEKDDINMGFELGKMHKYLSDWHLEMLDILLEIKK